MFEMVFRVVELLLQKRKRAERAERAELARKATVSISRDGRGRVVSAR